MNTLVDLKVRSWTKSFTWRILGVVILLPITYIFTGKLEDAAAVTLTFHLIRMVLYYFHERAWERITWGRFGHDDNRIWLYLSLALLIISFLIIILIL